MPSSPKAIRVVLARLRQEIAVGRFDEKSLGSRAGRSPDGGRASTPPVAEYSLLPLVNATGVILHTNLGRAPLAGAAIDHIRETAISYSNLEFDLATGERGKRDVHVDRLFRKLLDNMWERTTRGLWPTKRSAAPAISTIVVNNNAAAVLLALNSLAEGGEVIVSRGELVEIGGSFRIPDVMSKSQATLREVGTTNRTRIEDYERAINDRTRLLLRVHRSNFEITGFTEQPGLRRTGRSRPQDAIFRSWKIWAAARSFDLRSVGITGEPECSTACAPASTSSPTAATNFSAVRKRD